MRCHQRLWKAFLPSPYPLFPPPWRITSISFCVKLHFLTSPIASGFLDRGKKSFFFFAGHRRQAMFYLDLIHHRFKSRIRNLCCFLRRIGSILEPIRRTEQALISIIQEVNVKGVRTRKVDEQVHALGLEASAKARSLSSADASMKKCVSSKSSHSNASIHASTGKRSARRTPLSA